MPVRHVLVVDDSKSARLMLRKMLQSFGMTVDTAESAEEALNYLRDRQPDAIFMDHTMPGMDGLTAVQQIKNNPTTAAIPVAMYTSRDEPAYLKEARATGAIDVLTKPAMPEMLGVLLERMHQALDTAQAPITVSAPESGGTVSAEWVEKIVVDKAESVIYDAIESQVLPLLNDVIAKLRQEMSANQAKINQAAEQICREQLATWQPPLRDSVNSPLTEEAIEAQILPWLDRRLETFQSQERLKLEELVQDVATQICKDQLHELSERLVRQLSTRFAEAVRKAASTAREAAIEAAQEIVREVPSMPRETPTIRSETEDSAAAERAAHQFWVDTRRDLGRRIYWAAGCAAAVGIGAALLVYGLR
ncbi:MAG: response regulator [Gammaproteobacteria bacterium]|nr:response regulator [Gammaproteobacteria bacterium]MCP5196440.1 response regulator [Gammaproteobacteria bacterium]